MTTYELAIHTIHQLLDHLDPVDPDNDNSRQAVYDLLSDINNGYNLVGWPESQQYMEEEWFDDEAIFCGGSEEKTGSSAYFIPINRLL